MRVSVLLLCVSLCGCDPASVDDAGAPLDGGLDASSVTDGGSTDAGPPGADAGSGDAGSVDAGSVDAGSVDAGSAPRYSGTVSLGHNVDTHSLSGLFTESIPVERLLEGALSPLCTTIVESGGCRVFECPSASGFEPAGTLTASVNGTDVETATPGTENLYLATGSGRVFVAGDTVRFTSTGDVVPAFDVTVTAPATGTASVPSTISRTAPLTVTWSTATAPDRIQFVLSSPARVLACIVDGAGGSLTVDTTALGALAPTATGGFAMSAFNLTPVTVGDWDLLATASEALGTGAVTIE
ncbi:MAG: hypothetical protein H6719_06095 [Sandaracinaceae bacterium]|nr:hypothetical protein [Sandaracinaceae bacterium]